MGLTIVAYHELTPVAELSDKDRKELEGEFLHLRNAPPYTDRIAPLEEGDYLGCEVERETIGSYGYYAEFRDWLSSAFDDGRFAQLINFPDCDGFLGPWAVRELAGAFTSDGLDAALAKLPNDDARQSIEYTYWQLERCFRGAGWDGVIHLT